MSTSTTVEPRRRWTLRGALQPAASHTPERRARSLSGLPARRDPSQTWVQRLVTNPWLWISLVLFQLYALGLWAVYRVLSPDRVQGDMVMPGLDIDTLQKCAGHAAPTAAVWALVFIGFDRLRPMRPLLWLLSFGWGACMAVSVSFFVNSWVAELMNVSAGPGDPAAQARPAVFAAPFVEEAAKATILFLLAILVRHRIVSVLQSVGLAGLSAIGFAFTENIIYYARAMVYGSMTAETGDVDAAVQQLVILRGVMTSYGHPFFTMFTGIGLVLALRTRSKLVRILAPLTGFLLAALGHMWFNGSSTMGQQSETYYWIQFGVIVGGMVLFLTRHEFKELRRVRTRLEDYVRMGWLLPGDPINMGSARRRDWLCLVAIFRGPRVFLATLREMRALTELAYLRDAMVRGIVDEAGQAREKELLAEIDSLRGFALDEARGLRLTVNWARLAFWRRLRRPPQTTMVTGWPAPGA